MKKTSFLLLILLLGLFQTGCSSYPDMVIFLDRSGSMEKYWDGILNAFNQLGRRYPRIKCSIFGFDTTSVELFSDKLGDYKQVIDILKMNRPSIRKQRELFLYTGNNTHLKSFLPDAMSANASLAIVISDGISDPAENFTDVTLDSALSVLQPHFKKVFWVLDNEDLKEIDSLNPQNSTLLLISSLWSKKIDIKTTWSWWVLYSWALVFLIPLFYFVSIYVRFIMKFGKQPGRNK